ncbi:ionotropic receptor 93a [Zootermopsis nevadensis]|nr:ionotropic receptor 93a [Zootermopsis nevadensis]
MRHFLRNATHQHLTHGELITKFFTKTDIAVEKDITALFSILSCDDTWKIYRRYQDYHLLHLAITEADCPRLPRDDGLTVPLVAVNRVASQLMLDIKMSQLASWTTSILIYDESVDTETVQRIITSLSLPTLGRERSAAPVAVFKVNDTQREWERRASIMKLLKDFPVNRLGSNFIVAVSHEVVGVIMEVCKAVGLSHPETQWLYVIADSDAIINMSAFTSLLSEGENIAFVHNSRSSGVECEGGLLCHVHELLQSFVEALGVVIEDEEDFISQVSTEEWNAIQPSKRKRRSTLLDLMKAQLIETGRCDSCLTWTLEAGDTWGLEYQEHEEEETGQKIVRRLNPVGRWSPRDGLSMSSHLFPHLRKGFVGRDLTIISFHNPPWQIIKHNDTSQITEYKGLIFKIIDQLAENLNFRYTVIFPANNIPGWTNDSSLMKDSEDNRTRAFLVTDRIIEILRRKKVFLAAGAFVVTPNRKTLVNFTMPVSIQTATLLTARPREVSRALIFMHPFTYGTWACIATLIVMVTPVLNYFHRHSPYYEYYSKDNVKGGLSSHYNCLWYLYGALMQQGGMHLPEADSGRIIVGAWWLVVLVIVTSYGGNLVAFLTFPKYEVAVTNLEELLTRRGTVSWGILKDTATEQHLKEMDYPKYKSLFEGATIHEEQDDDLVSRVRSGSHVFIEWKLNLLKIMKKEFLSKNSCDFALGDEEFLEEQVAMMMQFGSPYLGLVNRELRRMHQAGLIYKWYLEYLPRKDRCWTTNRLLQATTHTVNLDDMQGSFFVLGLGCAFAMVLICMEQCYHTYKISKEKRVIKPFAS